MSDRSKASPAGGELITQAEAARLRGVGRAAIHRLIERGRLRSRLAGGRVMVYRDEVLRFSKQKTGPKRGGRRQQAEELERLRSEIVRLRAENRALRAELKRGRA